MVYARAGLDVQILVEPDPPTQVQLLIDEVAVFKRSLSLDEMNTLYNIGRGVFQTVPPTFANAPPSPQALYAGRTARFSALATGSVRGLLAWLAKDGKPEMECKE